MYPTPPSTAIVTPQTIPRSIAQTILAPKPSQGKLAPEFYPHPGLRATLSQWERDSFRLFPLPLGEGGAKPRVRVELAEPVDNPSLAAQNANTFRIEDQ